MEKRWRAFRLALSRCTDSLTFCHRAKHLRINAYVVMPTHLHLIAFDADLDSEQLARTLTDFRKYTGRQLSDDCTRHGPKCFLETLRHQAVADREQCFWQPRRHPEAISDISLAPWGRGAGEG